MLRFHWVLDQIHQLLIFGFTLAKSRGGNAGGRPVRVLRPLCVRVQRSVSQTCSRSAATQSSLEINPLGTFLGTLLRVSPQTWKPRTNFLQRLRVP